MYPLPVAALFVIVVIALVVGALLALLVRASLDAPRCAAGRGCLTNVARMMMLGEADARSMVVWGRVGTIEMPWVVDTGWAGAPALSLPWLTMPSLSAERCESEFAPAASRLARAAAPDSSTIRAALLRFVTTVGASSFTAGCTTTLIGIGASAVSTADLLLTPAIELRGTGEGRGFFSARSCAGGRLDADVLSTTRMPTASLLSCDWLRQNGPCLFSPQRGELIVAMRGAELVRHRARCRPFASELVNGAFVARVVIGGTGAFLLTVDTGSSLTIALGREAAGRLRTCTSDAPRHIQQLGSVGETVCSNVVWTEAHIAGRTVRTPVFLNDHTSDGIDGYIGLGLLVDLDLLITATEVHACVMRDSLDARERLASATSTGWCAALPACVQ